MLSVRGMKLRKIFRNPSENPRSFNDRVVHERIMTSKLLEPIQVGNLTFKNRIMFPPLTTGYEERDGSIGPRSLAFYQRLAKGGCSYVDIGDVANAIRTGYTAANNI